MPSKTINPTAQQVLYSLCSDPWSNDRKLAASHKLNLSTVTAGKNRLKRKGICKKAYLIAYNRLGFPLVSFSQLSNDRPPDAVLKAISKYQTVPFDDTDTTVVSYIGADPLNAFVMAHHRDFSAFKRFERAFGYGANWSQELCTMEGATKVVNFDHTNTINKLFFPQRFDPSRPKLQNTVPFKLRALETKIFDGLVAYQGAFSETVADKIGVTRQSVSKSLNKFRQEGLLDKATVVDLGRLGMQLEAIIKFRMNKASDQDIANIDRTLGPFYYWVFGNVHVMMAANIDYKDTMARLERLNGVKGILDIKIQLIQV